MLPAGMVLLLYLRVSGLLPPMTHHVQVLIRPDFQGNLMSATDLGQTNLSFFEVLLSQEVASSIGSAEKATRRDKRTFDWGRKSSQV
jgi:hypothetical protein